MVSRVLCLFTFVIAGSRVIAGDDDNDIDYEEWGQCLEMFEEENWKNGCCLSMDKLLDLSEKCQTDEDNWDCENSKCMLNADIEKDGEKDKICEKKVKAFLNDKKKEKPEFKETIEGIEKQCLNGTYDYYGPDEMCAATKLLVCSYLQILVTCPEWKATDACKKMSESSVKCKSVLDWTD